MLRKVVTRLVQLCGVGTPPQASSVALRPPTPEELSEHPVRVLFLVGSLSPPIQVPECQIVYVTSKTRELKWSRSLKKNYVRGIRLGRAGGNPAVTLIQARFAGLISGAMILRRIGFAAVWAGVCEWAHFPTAMITITTCHVPPQSTSSGYRAFTSIVFSLHEQV